ncbi:Ribosomal RNA large subunit methyltransferase H [Waddlia chondrophila 2032/99]|uniref:Ribosomal RNA large subunit methyltransferase H n=1 Tax=Waddlia chondrophila 2032/99 TaxID=765953 RepID=F8LC06_9BACT|nr:Ribosomal RNA large subunit methyltransferase H [Waddlia chondrophila 2032/99]
MYHIKIFSVGKTKEQWLTDAVNEYEKRLCSTVKFECIWAKHDEQLKVLSAKEKHLVLLDPNGKLMTSEQFSEFLVDQLECGGSKLTLIIGGSDGIPKELKGKGPQLSLSPLTFTHQMTRLILIEQIYRALEIEKGSNYHRA